jgi:Mlc titration factor MtfA (ptsG expression regulator)
LNNGGERGIRTLGGVATTTVFETVPFSLSGISPLMGDYDAPFSEKFTVENPMFCLSDHFASKMMIKWPWKSTTLHIEHLEKWQNALDIPMLASLNTQEKSKLIQIASQFLQLKKLRPQQGLELDELSYLRIALLFALPVMELGVEWLDTFHEILLYPTPFSANQSWQDNCGQVHPMLNIHSGESWQQGPLILNWQEIEDSFDTSGFNLIIHQAAHQLDMRHGGEVNGLPPLALRHIAAWEHDLHAAMENIQEEIELVGEEIASIDAEAAQDPGECFAVLSEYFFSAPELLINRFPLVYGHFSRLYRQDPLARLQRTQERVAN